MKNEHSCHVKRKIQEVAKNTKCIKRTLWTVAAEGNFKVYLFSTPSMMWLRSPDHLVDVLLSCQPDTTESSVRGMSARGFIMHMV